MTFATCRGPLRTLIPIGLILLSATLATAQRRERTIDSWKPLHYGVSMSFNNQLTEISSARTEISLQVLGNNVTKIDLDFGDMPIDSVSVAGAPARFERT